ncbi:MAG: hypothetical protein A3B68_08160 [Candidatus Melainabacteria bacterium RIFCSPHIGHO2_02_FULL_34_12]|nr:MAG: hypothetical protein A3B68_08160 [Candidatus Melainabacteria bacterium RIFCSPHIGHO2_02_FULL_34_12]
MLSAEEDCFINCPFCLESIAVRIDRTGGQNQFLTYDCEVCCRPITLQVEINDDGNINIMTEKES